jgi:hypothetical protein
MTVIQFPKPEPNDIDLVEEAHEQEGLRRQAEFYNFGWGTNWTKHFDEICSKTSHVPLDAAAKRARSNIVGRITAVKLRRSDRPGAAVDRQVSTVESTQPMSCTGWIDYTT